MIRSYLKRLLKRLYLAVRTIGLTAAGLFVRWQTNCRVDDDQIRKILLLRTDRLGDMVLTLPLLAAVRRRWPEAKITLLCRATVAPLVAHDPSIDHMVTLPITGDRPGVAWSAWDVRAMIRQLRQEGFDLVIDPYDGDDLEAARLARKINAPRRAGFSVAGRSFFLTETTKPVRGQSFFAQQQVLATSLGIAVPLETPRLVLTEAERRAAAARLRDRGLDPGATIVGIHPGGYYATQRWPLGRFFQLAKQLEQEDRVQVVFFGTRAEERLIAQIGMDVDARAAVFFGLELRELLALMSWCRLFVCNNSGPLHMAAALGVATVSTMGPTDHRRWWPVGEGHVVVRKPLWCSPCKEGICPLGTHQCLLLVSIEEMLAAVRRQLAEQAKSAPHPALVGSEEVA